VSSHYTNCITSANISSKDVYYSGGFPLLKPQIWNSFLNSSVLNYILRFVPVHLEKCSDNTLNGQRPFSGVLLTIIFQSDAIRLNGAAKYTMYYVQSPLPPFYLSYLCLWSRYDMGVSNRVFKLRTRWSPLTKFGAEISLVFQGHWLLYIS
jgi:hypothetical protein